MFANIFNDFMTKQKVFFSAYLKLFDDVSTTNSPLMYLSHRYQRCTKCVNIFFSGCNQPMEHFACQFSLECVLNHTNEDRKLYARIELELFAMNTKCTA